MMYTNKLFYVITNPYPDFLGSLVIEHKAWMSNYIS